jgi:hypothetical protein
MQSHMWGWYLLGAFMALFAKYSTFLFIGLSRKGQKFLPTSKAWFEIVTIDSQVSWLASVAVVWLIGAMYIRQIGISWLFGGALLGLPVFREMCFLLGVLAEYVAPGFLKWLLVKKLGISDDKSRGGEQ